MKRPTTMPAIRTGDVLVISEADYCYGVGELVLRVTAVDPDPPPGVEWIRIVGVQVRWDGSDGDRRDVLVRATALPAAVRAGVVTPGRG